jgi:hypothetical protein
VVLTSLFKCKKFGLLQYIYFQILKNVNETLFTFVITLYVCMSLVYLLQLYWMQEKFAM